MWYWICETYSALIFALSSYFLLTWLALVSMVLPLLLFSLRVWVAAVDLGIIYVKDNDLYRISISYLICLLLWCIALLIVVGLIFSFFTNAILQHLQIRLMNGRSLAIWGAGHRGVFDTRLALPSGIIIYRACGSEVQIRRVSTERTHLNRHHIGRIAKLWWLVLRALGQHARWRVPLILRLSQSITAGFLCDSDIDEIVCHALLRSTHRLAALLKAVSQTLTIHLVIREVSEMEITAVRRGP